MRVDLSRTEALDIAQAEYGGGSDVLTFTQGAREDPGSLEWWSSDHGMKADRGWRGQRDGAALIAYRHLSRHCIEPIPGGEFPVEFELRDGWCRPDKDIVKQGLRRRFLEPVQEGDRVVRFRLTASGLCHLAALGFSEV